MLRQRGALTSDESDSDHTSTGSTRPKADDGDRLNPQPTGDGHNRPYDRLSPVATGRSRTEAVLLASILS
jgi:hypothetical protein